MELLHVNVIVIGFNLCCNTDHQINALRVH